MREEHLVREFIAEAEEHLLRLEPQLLQLEQEPDNVALVQDIFIATHAIKGTAAYVGLAHISEFTNVVESVLDRLRQQELRVSTDIIDGLLQGLDSLQRLIQHVSAGKPAPDTSEIERLLAQWSAPPGEPANDITPGIDHADSMPNVDLSVDEIQALDPEDVEIFADIAGQQLDWMRLSSERLGQALCRNEAEQSEHDVHAAAASLLKAFRTMQSSAMMLETASLHAVFAQQAPVFVALDTPEALSKQNCEQIFQTLETLEHVIAALSGIHRRPAPSTTPSPPSVMPEILDGTVVLAGSQMLRVDVGRIDALVNLAGELVSNRARLVHIEHVLNALHDDVRTGTDAFLSPMPESRKTTVRILKKLREHLNEATTDLGRLANQFQESAMRVRMIPISQVVSRFPRMVRDLSRQSGKEVALDIQGADTELDKSVMDMIADPLIHLLRNAIDHGIESPDERKAQGKEPQGHILLSASHQGNQVLITIQDDGRGVDAEQIRQKAIQRHLVTADDATAMAEDEILALIFRTGFSTLDRASSLSGRGVGLHLVKRYLEQVNGTIEFDTIPGTGSTFALKFPLTLAIIPALLVSIQTDIYAIPLAAVEEAVRIPGHASANIEAQRMIDWRGTPVPLVHLFELLEEPKSPTITASDWAMFDDVELPLPEIEEIFPDPFFDQEEHIASGVIVSVDNQALGLIVDRFLGESDIVITALKHDLIAVEGISGASIQPDGSIAFVLDAAALIRLANSKK